MHVYVVLEMLEGAVTRIEVYNNPATATDAKHRWRSANNVSSVEAEARLADDGTICHIYHRLLRSA